MAGNDEMMKKAIVRLLPYFCKNLSGFDKTVHGSLLVKDYRFSVFTLIFTCFLVLIRLLLTKVFVEFEVYSQL
jgi:hypothetical protein